jgi:hypothetical protein
MFPWWGGDGGDGMDNHREQDTDMNSANHDELQYDLDMDVQYSTTFVRRYKALSTDQLPPCNLRDQLEFGGKCTIFLSSLIQLYHQCCCHRVH